MNPTISILICTHNGAARLPETFACLRAQRVPETVTWEVLLVDNASTDDTVAVARAHWPEADAPAPLRIVPEPQLGLGHARSRGVRSAQGEIISLVDDDNWVCPDWVATVAEIFRDCPEVGACGGPSTGVFEVDPPAWFDRYENAYAVGTQAEVTGLVPSSRGYLWGAGLSVRRQPWLALVEGGMQFFNTGRSGKRLSCGEDVELCLALILAGWELWYDTRLQMQHYMTAPRLSWGYLQRMYRGFGTNIASIMPYRQAVSRRPDLPPAEPPRHLLRQSRDWVRYFFQTAPHPWQAILGRCPEGDHSALEWQMLLGKLTYLWQQNADYRQSFIGVRATPWQQLAAPPARNSA